MALPVKETLGCRIYLSRQTLSMTRVELGALIGLTEGAIRHLEDGRSKDIGGAYVFPLADALEVSARWLLTGVADEPQR